MKNQKGAISVFVMLSMLFFLSFIMVTYNVVIQKSIMQEESTEALKGIYESPLDAQTIYFQKFVNKKLNPEEITEEEKKYGISASFYARNGKIYDVK